MAAELEMAEEEAVVFVALSKGDGRLRVEEFEAALFSAG